MNPLIKFRDWYKEESDRRTVIIHSACCLGTIGLDGFPNARMVSLKEVVEEGFVITGALDSRKGRELIENPVASLTFWWTETARQVRVQGKATVLPDYLADKYFEERNKDAQLLAHVSKQGSEIDDLEGLRSRFERQKEELQGKDVSRPPEWSGFCIKPIRIEFMEFEESRFHRRELFFKEGNTWKSKWLQP